MTHRAPLPLLPAGLLLFIPAGLVLMIAGGCADNLTHPDPLLPWTTTPGQPLTCTPNLDGRVEASELKAALGIAARYRISDSGASPAIDVVGKVDGDGQRVWDWSANADTDRAATFVAESISGRWYSNAFGAGTFAAPLDGAGAVVGVYRHDDKALWLLGTASAKEKPAEGQTLLVYDDPIPLFRFPIEPGRKWKASSKISNGTLYGLPWVGEDSYTMSVDAAGRLELPDLTLTQAHRVRIDMTIKPAIGPVISQRRVSFLFECLGEVARATSHKNEKEADFSVASEVRRLGL